MGSATHAVMRETPPEVTNITPWLLTERMACNFFHWSQLSFCAAPKASQGGIEVPEDHSIVFHCRKCSSPILQFCDIVSNNYRGALGPAFLVDRLFNVSVDGVAYSASFVTGGYTVSDVACAVCRVFLGKKYLEARDLVNGFKVGKFLLEQTMVFQPGCCSGPTV